MYDRDNEPQPVYEIIAEVMENIKARQRQQKKEAVRARVVAESREVKSA